MSGQHEATAALDSADEIRAQLLDALDFSYCLGLGYSTPEELLAKYDASRTPPPATRAQRMPRHYRDADGHRLELAADTDHDGRPVVTVWAHAPFARIPVRVPLNEVQALVTSLQETARQAAAGSNPQHIGGGANAEDCPACDGTNPPYPFICPGDQQ